MLKSLAENLYTSLVFGKEKAVAAFAVGWGVTFVAQHLGYHVSNGLQQIVVSSVVALLLHFSVYLTNNRG